MNQQKPIVYTYMPCPKCGVLLGRISMQSHICSPSREREAIYPKESGKQCEVCKRRLKPRTKWQFWTDYATQKRIRVCPLCFSKAKLNRRNKSIPFSSTFLHKGTMPVNKLRAITISKYEQHLRKQLKKGAVCPFCGSGENIIVHHYRFRSEGGRDEQSNYLVMCKKCEIERYHPEQLNKMR